MGGIYIHIPYCLSRCSYCDFYSVTKTDSMQSFVRALLREMELRSMEIKGESCDTLYLGGGTPSLLPTDSLRQILAAASQFFTLSKDAEITMEVNPEDISPAVLDHLAALGINRISIGIQSIQNRHLDLMKRRHNAQKALDVLAMLKVYQLAGHFEVSADLIYGIPDLTRTEWSEAIEGVIASEVNHLSAYHLTWEKGTRLTRKLKAGLIHETDEEESWWQYNHLADKLAEHGFEHYEISNFARNGKQSRHNTKYWSGDHYIGLGPSAHSFNGNTRSWNRKDLKSYLDYYLTGGLTQNPARFMLHETIEDRMQWNELLMTRLRTMWGIQRSEVVAIRGKNGWLKLMKEVRPFVKSGDAIAVTDRISLTRKGWFRSDGILATLFE